MGRRYTVTFEEITVSGTTNDLIEIKGGAGVQVRIIRAWWGPGSGAIATSQTATTRCRLLPATVSSGTGGGTPTVNKTDPTDAAATLTALRNNTTKATSSNTPVVVDESGDHLYNGYKSPQTWLDGKSGPLVRSTSSFVMEMLSSLSGTVVLSGGVEVEETGA